MPGKRGTKIEWPLLCWGILGMMNIAFFTSGWIDGDAWPRAVTKTLVCVENVFKK
jgi:hypothetical protein